MTKVAFVDERGGVWIRTQERYATLRVVSRIKGLGAVYLRRAKRGELEA